MVVHLLGFALDVVIAYPANALLSVITPVILSFTDNFVEGVIVGGVISFFSVIVWQVASLPATSYTYQVVVEVPLALTV